MSEFKIAGKKNEGLHWPPYPKERQFHHYPYQESKSEKMKIVTNSQ